MNCDNLGQNGFLMEYNVNCLKRCDKEFFFKQCTDKAWCTLHERRKGLNLKHFNEHSICVGKCEKWRWKAHDKDNTAEGRRRKIRKVSKFEKAPADNAGWKERALDYQRVTVQSHRSPCKQCLSVALIRAAHWGRESERSAGRWRTGLSGSRGQRGQLEISASAALTCWSFSLARKAQGRVQNPANSASLLQRTLPGLWGSAPALLPEHRPAHVKLLPKRKNRLPRGRYNSVY